MIKPHVFDESLSHDTPWSSAPLTIVADDTKPFLALYFGFGQMGCLVREFYLGGEIFTPYEPSDVRNGGQWSILFNWNEAWRHGWRIENNEFQGLYEDGTRAVYSRDVHSFFGTGNSPLANGEYPSDEIGVYNSSKYKGWIDPDIMRIMGWNNDQYGALFSGPEGAFIKLDEYMVHPWVDGKDSPFGGIMNASPVFVTENG